MSSFDPRLFKPGDTFTDPMTGETQTVAAPKGTTGLGAALGSIPGLEGRVANLLQGRPTAVAPVVTPEMREAELLRARMNNILSSAQRGAIGMPAASTANPIQLGAIGRLRPGGGTGSSMMNLYNRLRGGGNVRG